ncbi:deoxynucleoside kinase [Enterovibrio calviensis]|uniref:deoxynucleoside kinase n=1 Tax=Enterovibrio calviensis TaxID=91359 RepID=UPI00047FACF7|nr:deoxynucleoside kinase [Enterovibrio calviensis]
MQIVAIEGGIAAGKSTLIASLANHLTTLTGDTWETVKEPVDEDPEFHRLLKQFIDNPNDADKRAEFQMYITRTRQKLLASLPDGNYIIERSLFSDLVFTQCNMLSTEGATGAYQAAYYDIKEHLKAYPKIDLVVYLNRSPEACYNAMVGRNREGEEGYTLEYFQDIHSFHKACLPQITRTYGTKYVETDLGWKFPDARLIAPMIMKELN